MKLFGALVAILLCVPATAGAWTKPRLLLNGDAARLLGTVVRTDGSLRAGVYDRRHNLALGLVDGAAAPLAVLRAPATVADLALSADGSGIALDVAHDGPFSLIAFDAAGVAQPPVALDAAIENVDIATSPAGAAMITWLAKSAQGYEVDAAFRDPGATSFGAPVRAGYAEDKDTLISAGIGDNGEAVVAWQTNYFPSDLAAAVRSPGAGFSPARFVLRQAIDAKLAVGPGGQAIVATSDGRGLDVSIKPPGAAAMPDAQRVDRANEGYSLAVAAAGPHRVAAAWLAGNSLRGPARLRVYAGEAKLRRIGSVGKDAGGEDIGLAIDAAGTTTVAWEEGLRAKPGDPTARSHLGIAYRPAGTHFSAPVYAGPVSLAMTPESVAVGPGGRAWVFYEAFGVGDTGPGYRRVYVTERTP